VLLLLGTGHWKCVLSLNELASDTRSLGGAASAAAARAAPSEGNEPTCGILSFDLATRAAAAGAAHRQKTGFEGVVF
jgi:hypothetical protein